MTKTSKLLKVKECQHCTAHALNLLLMTDSITQNSKISGLVCKYKDIVKTLDYKADMLKTEVKDTNDETAAKALLKKIDEAFEEEMKSKNSEGIGTETGYDETRASASADVCDTDISIGSALENDVATTTADSQIKLKRVYRLQSEMPVRWNFLLAMLSSLSSMRKETDNCLKMNGQCDKCLKASE